MRTRLASAVKGFAGATAVALERTFGERRHGRFGILLYHRLCDPGAAGLRPTMNVTPARFRAQIQGLLRRGVRFVSLSHAIAQVRAGNALPPTAAVLTFDDGYSGVFHHAFPVLKELAVPATIFLATAYVGEHRPFPFDEWGNRQHRDTPADCWQPLDISQCRVMLASGLIEFGGHSHTHRDFRGKPRAFADDLQSCWAFLRDQLRVAQPAFAFPYGGRSMGYSTPDFQQLVRAAGFASALSTEIELADPRESPFQWGRMEVVGLDSAAVISAKLNGWYEWMNPGRAWFRKLARPQPPFFQE